MNNNGYSVITEQGDLGLGVTPITEDVNINADNYTQTNRKMHQYNHQLSNENNNTEHK